MTRLHLVRHGHAAAGWDGHSDPGLDDVGRAQAAATAERLAPLGPMPVVVSPMRRCRETAEPLLVAWGVEPIVDARVGEIPSPTDDLVARSAWLRDAMAGTWEALGERWHRWRTGVLAALLEIPDDAVVVSHFVAINVAIGLALGDERLVVRMPGNASVTVIDADGERLHLVSDPDQVRDTTVL